MIKNMEKLVKQHKIYLTKNIKKKLDELTKEQIHQSINGMYNLIYIYEQHANSLDKTTCPFCSALRCYYCPWLIITKCNCTLLNLL